MSASGQEKLLPTFEVAFLFLFFPLRRQHNDAECFVHVVGDFPELFLGADVVVPQVRLDSDARGGREPCREDEVDQGLGHAGADRDWIEIT